MVTVTMMQNIGIAMALQIGGTIGLLLAVAHQERSAARQLRYEREVAQDAALHAAAQAAVQRYRRTGPRNSAPTAR